jgi:hypothetical protein
MRRFLLCMVAVALSACREDVSPLRPLSPTSAHHDVGIQPAEWRGHWQSPADLWVYDATPELGLNAHLHDGATRATHAQMIANAGMRLVRNTIHWNLMESSDPATCIPWTWAPPYCGSQIADFRDKVNQANANGLEIVAVVHGDGGGNPYAADGNLQNFNQHFYAFLQKMMTENPEVKFWQIGNEQDHPSVQSPWRRFGGEGAQARAQAYASTLRAIRPLFPSGGNRWLIVGGMTGGASNTDWQFLESLYQALDASGGKPYPFDFIAYHAYGDSPYEPYWGPFSTLYSLLPVMNQHGDGNRPLWLTETGTNSDHYVRVRGCPAAPYQSAFDSQQSTFYQQLLAGMPSQPIWRVMPYNLWAEPSDGGGGAASCGIDPSPNYGSALLRNDLVTPRPAFQYLQGQAAATRAHWAQPAATGSYFIATTALPRDYPWEYTGTDQVLAIKNVSVSTLVPTRIRMAEPIRFQMYHSGGIGWHWYHGNNDPAVAGDQVVEALSLRNIELASDVSVSYQLYSEQGYWLPVASNGAVAGYAGGWPSRADRAYGLRIWLNDPQYRGMNICYSIRTIASPTWMQEQCDGWPLIGIELVNGVRIRVYNPQWR